ncbi:MAG: group II truncated hemoglobin [Rhizobacter sp.]
MSGAEDGAQEVTPPFELLGGAVAIRALVDRFYDLMDLEPGFALLRGLHPASLDESRDKLFWFLCGWLGGPPLYEERFGHPRLRARHMPYSIGIAERDQWMACMVQAMNEQGLSAEWIERLTASFHNTADWMRNRGV